jgi:hypothetical protein
MNGVRTGTISEPDGVLPPRLLDPLLLSPARLIASLWLEPAGLDTRAGRGVVLASARPRVQRPGRSLSYTFEFDSEHGTTLRRAAFDGGHCYQITEAMALRYNAPINPDKFTFAVPQSASSRNPESGMGQ